MLDMTHAFNDEFLGTVEDTILHDPRLLLVCPPRTVRITKELALEYGVNLGYEEADVFLSDADSYASNHEHRRFSVCKSAAGYYVGVWCPVCGPYSRYTDYMSKEYAEDVLKIMETDNPGSTVLSLQTTPRS